MHGVSFGAVLGPPWKRRSVSLQPLLRQHASGSKQETVVTGARHQRTEKEHLYERCVSSQFYEDIFFLRNEKKVTNQEIIER